MDECKQDNSEKGEKKMETVFSNGFCEMSHNELMDVDGGVGLLAAALICGGCFVAGAGIVGGICFLVG